MSEQQEKQSIFEGRKYIYEVGRRKTAVATVRLYDKGKNEIYINGQKLEDFYKNEALRRVIQDVFVKTSSEGQFDASIQVKGGGQNSQAECIRHGLARAISSYDSEKRGVLKKAGYLTRDPRKKERKKPGLKGARRAPQWSKR